MNKAFNTVERKMLLAVVAIGIAVAVYFLLYQPLDLERDQARARHEIALQELEIVQARIAQGEQIEAEHHRLADAMRHYSSGFYTDELQDVFIERIKELVDNNGLRFMSATFSGHRARFDNNLNIIDSKLRIDDLNREMDPEYTPLGVGAPRDPDLWRDRETALRTYPDFVRFLEGVTVTTANVSVSGTYQQVYDLMGDITNEGKYIFIGSLNLTPTNLDSYGETIPGAPSYDMSTLNGLDKESDRVYSVTMSLSFYTVSPLHYYMDTLRER